MTLIEGVGDEVTIFISLLLIAIVVCLAWISTNVPDLGGIRVIILDHTNFHRLGEIARRYQIIGYQIISGHVLHNNNNAAVEGGGGEGEEEEERTGDEEDEEEEEEGGEEDQTQADDMTVERTESLTESSGDDDLPDLISEESDPLQAATSQLAIKPHQTPNTEQPLNREVPEPATGSSLAEEEPCDITTPDELRQRRIAFFDKTTSSETSRESSPSVSDVKKSVQSLHSDNVLGLSLAPEEGSSVDESLLQTLDGSSKCSDNTNIVRGAQSEPRVDNISNQSVPRSESVECKTREENTSTQVESLPRSAEGQTASTPDEGHISVKIKYLDDRQRQVQAKPNDTIGEFKRRHFAGELAENMLVRFIYNGRELRQDASTLQSCNITDGAVIHCLLTRNQPHTNNIIHQQVQDQEFNMGSLMLPLFGLMLALIWYCRFSYRAYFNAMSTLSLIGITFMYGVALMAVYRHHDNHQHVD